MAELWKLKVHHQRGERATALELVASEERIRIGWGELGDLRLLTHDQGAFKAALSAVYGSAHNKAGGANSLLNFLHMRPGDLCIVSGDDPAGLVVEVTGDYEFHPEDGALSGGYYHQRKCRRLGSPARSIWPDFNKVADRESSRWTLARLGSVPREFVSAGGASDARGEWGVLKLPPLDAVTPELTTESLLVCSRPATETLRWHDEPAPADARAIGRRGEEIVRVHLLETLSAEARASLVWRSDISETPGWDLDYEENGELVRIEVKATKRPSFTSIDVTANEWDAAVAHGAGYRLALVVDAGSSSPRIQWWDDPCCAVAGGDLRVKPTAYRISRAR